LQANHPGRVAKKQGILSDLENHTYDAPLVTLWATFGNTFDTPFDTL
jgi:hypothetical protein